MDEYVVRFWSKVDQKGPNECWLWTAYRYPQGYGAFAIARCKPRHASRVAWQLTYGEIPEGMSVLHHCDNPPCVNPSHLFLGTHRDNALDAIKKGLMKPPPPQLGERNSKHKLTVDQVRGIRRVRGWYPGTLLGEAFGVVENTILNVWSNRTWTEHSEI